MSNDTVARQRLDQRFEEQTHRLSRPHRGWIRAIRESLGMTQGDLARRLDISPQSVAELETNEQRGRIRLDSLERAAEAMDCEVVYSIVPRTSLEEIVRRRARAKATRLLDAVGHHSRLEDQALTEQDRQHQLDELARDLIDEPGLWRD